MDSIKCKPKLLIISKPLEEVESLRNALSGTFEVLPVQCSEVNAVSMLFFEVPAVAVINMSLKDIDPISVIERIKRSEYFYNVQIFLLANSVNASMQSVMQEYDAQACFDLKMPTEEIAARIIGIYADFLDSSSNNGISSICDKLDVDIFINDSYQSFANARSVLNGLIIPLGFSPQLVGTKYLMYILTAKCCGSQMSLNNIYAFVADKFNTTPKAVERSVRYAIERAWMVGDIALQFKIFGYSVDAGRGKPTNSEFVARLSECITPIYSSSPVRGD